MFQLLHLTNSVSSLYLSISQPDYAVRALHQTADLLLQDRNCSEDVDKGLALLSKALNTLVTSGRHSRAASVGMKMLNFGFDHDNVGSEMIEVGKTCLKMFVMTNNINMTGNCLITLILLLIKHFENNVKVQANILYQDNVGNITKEVRDNLKTFLESDWDKLALDGDIEKLRSKIRRGETKDLLVGELVSSPGCSLTERREPRGPRVSKSTLMLAGAALPLSVLAFNPRSQRGVSQFREVGDQRRDGPGRSGHADENGYEAFQPQDVGKPDTFINLIKIYFSLFQDIMGTHSEY